MAAHGGHGGGGIKATLPVLAGDPSILFGDDADVQARAAALSRALTGQQGDAYALQAVTGGYRAAPGIGQQLAQDAITGQQQIGVALQARQANALQRAMLEHAHAQQSEVNALRQSQLAETQRHNQAVEALTRETKPPKPPKYALVTGEGGAQFYADPTDPSTPAIPLVGPDGKPISKPGADKPLTESQGQAAMFLKQGETALEQAMKMGDRVMPSTGLAGVGESLAWKARERGFPQLSGKDTLARQSLLLSIAEPIIRAESGAAVPAEEVRRLALRYIPMPGEPPEEHQRKLGALVSAIDAVAQKLPPGKAAEFKPFYDKAKKWAASFGGAAPPTAAGGAETSVGDLRKLYGLE